MRVVYSSWNHKNVNRRYYRLSYKKSFLGIKTTPWKNYISAIRKQAKMRSYDVERINRIERQYEFANELFHKLLPYFYTDVNKGLSVLYSPTKLPSVVLVRELLSYIIYRHTRVSLKSVTDIVCGNPDHSTTSYYLKEVELMLGGFAGRQRQKEARLFIEWFEKIYGEEYPLCKLEELDKKRV